MRIFNIASCHLGWQRLFSKIGFVKVAEFFSFPPLFFFFNVIYEDKIVLFGACNGGLNLDGCSVCAEHHSGGICVEGDIFR